MFAQPLAAAGPSGLTRPVIVALVLLLLFLSMQAEWAPSQRKPDLPRKRFLSMGDTPSNQLDQMAVRDEIVKQLSISNERLEIANAKLQQHTLDVRQAMRECNCTSSGLRLDSDEISSGLHLLPQPEFADVAELNQSSNDPLVLRPSNTAAQIESRSNQETDNVALSSSSHGSLGADLSLSDQQPAQGSIDSQGSKPAEKSADASQTASSGRVRHERGYRRHGAASGQPEPLPD